MKSRRWPQAQTPYSQPEGLIPIPLSHGPDLTTRADLNLYQNHLAQPTVINEKSGVAKDSTHHSANLIGPQWAGHCHTTGIQRSSCRHHLILGTEMDIRSLRRSKHFAGLMQTEFRESSQ
ncbi:hypothetical protein PGT21_015044 [Puccinia graminis f. sp. tritici]|uniref:Uncharacterized protein n=1 Tax=Puccinia graminis f. sp. tritici TaxID=56615 RepID=A0A5B0MDB6_PUCGR|nr:hypothetical protein PGT21_015044 [Puccinia graminis f. sp. tritici]KAA1115914.1 hypothetical protein PGTUg99_020885 [Puccinia graminis f. sp. tritici]